MESNYSLADVQAAVGNRGMFGSEGGGIWIFALLILLMLGNGNLFGGNAATTADIQRSVDLNSIQQGQAGIAADIQRGIYEINSNTSHAAYDSLSEIRDVQSAIASGFANQQTCCCETQRAIDGVNYNLATQSAAIQANDTANTQKVLDAISTNRMADMQNQINSLQLQQALCGVPRVSPYGYGMYPTFPMFGNVQ